MACERFTELIAATGIHRSTASAPLSLCTSASHAEASITTSLTAALRAASTRLFGTVFGTEFFQGRLVPPFSDELVDEAHIGRDTLGHNLGGARRTP